MKLHLARRAPLKVGAVALLIVILATGVALALTMSNADGKWSNVQPISGSTVGCLRYGNPTQWSTNVNTYQDTSTVDENQVRWGSNSQNTCVEGTSQSGFGFDGTNGSLTFDPGQTFLLGKFVHYNNPVTFPGGAEQRPASMNLAITLAFSDPVTSATLNYNVLFDETANSANPCPYGDSTGNGCDDRVTFPSSLPDQTLTISGVDYTLQVIGFVPDADGVCPSAPAGATNSIYTTGERRNNYACLYGQIVVREDSGDAPDLGLGQTTGASRARHNITSSGPYLGTARGDGENDGQPNPAATGDDTSAFDDEDGYVAGDTNWTDSSGWITVQVNRGTAAGADRACVYAWIDWTGNGFGVGNDSTAQGERMTAGTGNVTLTFTNNLPTSAPSSLLVRLRVRSNSGACPAIGTTGNGPTGLWTDGEVEDHLLTFNPLAVELAVFIAATSPEGVTLAWETVSEIDITGFNLYRAENASGPWAQINAALIPAQAPGAAAGGSYAFTDSAAPQGATLWYQLEDMALDGATTRHEPVEVAVATPNAVRLSAFGAAAPAAGPALAGLAAVALAAARLGLRRRRS